jgi:DNA end-binding protein Ku
MVDRYQAALRELVEAKVAGRHLEQPPGPTHTDGADNLMEALRRSVEQAKHDRGDAAPAAKPARKRPAKAARTQQAVEPVRLPQPAAAKKATAPKKSPARKSPAKKSPADKSVKNR